MNLRAEMKKTLCILMAGGKGERLYPLTKVRAKPSVRFGGIYRIVDFTLSNCLNSDIRKIYVLTQYRSVSLDRHIRLGWNIFNHELDEFIECIPPQQRNVDRWYRGTADSIYQNIHILQRERPERVLVLSGDHVYKMNYNDMLAFHIEKGAEATVAGVEVPRSQASAFGIIGCDQDFRIGDWEEKPSDPKPVPGKPDVSFVSMGVYIFNTEVLVMSVIADAKKSSSSHDFGKDVIPAMIESNRVFVHSFAEPNNISGRYWRDIGTLDAYWEANMDLCSDRPHCDLYDKGWPIRTYQEQFPPARIVSNPGKGRGKMGEVVNSLVSGGCVIAGGKVKHSVLSHQVHVLEGALVEDSVLLDSVVVGSGSRIRRAIIDQEVVVPDGFDIGYDSELDSKRFTISPGGVTVVPRGIRLD
ncbi:MAG: glucose-1-phosphate adenylyltransferase [Deltaproteobacteria bacterium]|nr:glucose-1-phosphate adenylyltransferase [Deltaproteobacteria bacterium]